MFKRLPSGIPYIIGNEAAERYSYYGMRSILVIFMTKYLLDSSGNPDYMNPEEAKAWYHMFSTAVYFFPILGSIISDVFWGKYKTIINLSIIYCLGHLVLALFETRTGLATGLTLIAVGAGGIKPCVSAHVGDQFDHSNSDLLAKIFSYFYFSINLGAFLSIFFTPILLDKVSPNIAFGVPGLLMFIATVLFYSGRKKFIAIPPAGFKKFKDVVFSKEGLKAVFGLSVIYLFVAVFWALFDQTGSSWVLQAEKMNRHVDLTFGVINVSWLKFELLASQISALNPVLIMVFVPIFTHGIYPFLERYMLLTALRKMTAGFFITGLSFAIISLAQERIDSGYTPTIMWQFLAYTIMTVGEVLISITALEFSYTQAPNAMKSFIMGVFLLSVSLGNFVTAMVNIVIQNPDGTTKLEGASYFWFFTVLVITTGIIFAFVVKYYKEESYIQDYRSK